MTSESGTRSPRSMYAFASRPRSLPVFTWCRSASPVEMCFTPYFFTRRSHCVPLPDPGPPEMIIFSCSFEGRVYWYTPYAPTATPAAPATLSILEMRCVLFTDADVCRRRW